MLSTATMLPVPAADTTVNEHDLRFVFAALTASLPLAIRVVSPDRQVVYATAEYRRLFDAADASCCAQLGIPHRESDCPSARTFASGRPCAVDRWLGRVYARVVTSPVFAADGQVIASVEWIQDNTTVKTLEAALARQSDLLETINKAMIEANHNLESAQSELEVNNRSLAQANARLIALDQQKDEFVSIVSHELKAPLTSVKASVDLILNQEDDALPERVRSLLEICRRNVGRLHSLIMDLLDIARIESGMMSYQVTRFPATRWIEECADNVRTLAVSKGLRLAVVAGGADVIEADRDRLLQVVVNLANNAVKFTDHGDVTLTVDVQPTQLICSVRDTGIGIPPAALDTIFDKFAQVKDGARRNTLGTGLGLAIARAITNEHGGTLNVHSELGVGSVFTLTIPQPPAGRVTHATSPVS